MSGYALAWAIITGAGIACLVFVGLLLRHSVRPLLLWPALALLAAVMLVPAPHPGADGTWAPAFLVALFEGLFQTDGKPTTALRLLLAGCLSALALSGGVCGLIALRQNTLRRRSDERDRT